MTISGTIVPIDQMSTGHEYCFAPSRISGARYHSVTTWAAAEAAERASRVLAERRYERTSCVYVRSGTVNARARPKSASFSVPFFGSTSTFCGLRSLRSEGGSAQASSRAVLSGLPGKVARRGAGAHRWKMRCWWHHARPLSIW